MLRYWTWLKSKHNRDHFGVHNACNLVNLCDWVKCLNQKDFTNIYISWSQKHTVILYVRGGESVSILKVTLCYSIVWHIRWQYYWKDNVHLLGKQDRVRLVWNALRWYGDTDLCVGGQISSCPSAASHQHSKCPLTEDKRRGTRQSVREKKDVLLKDVEFDLSPLIWWHHTEFIAVN